MPRYNNILTTVYLPKIEQYHIIYHVMSIMHDNVYQDNVYQNNIRIMSDIITLPPFCIMYIRIMCIRIISFLTRYVVIEVRWLTTFPMWPTIALFSWSFYARVIVSGDTSGYCKLVITINVLREP